MSLSTDFKKMADDLLRLSDDAKILAAKKSGKGEMKKLPSSKSFQPVTRIYKNKEDIKESKKDPDLSNFLAKMNDIFKG